MLDEKQYTSSDDSRDAGTLPDVMSSRDAQHDNESQYDVEGARESIGERDEGTGGIASRIVSRISARSNFTPAPPPDGGFTAIMVAIAGHMVVMCTWGVINSFGAYQAYYSTFLDRPLSDLSWIGSFQVFLLFFIGTFTGRATDAGFLRPCLMIGIFLLALGVFTAAQCTQYWQLFLAQGVCIGLGNGFLFCPMVAVTSSYWSRKRGLVLGLQACGSATGGLIFPSMVRQLLPRVGFPWTMRATGFLQIALLLFAFVWLKPRLPPRRTGSLIDFASFKELDYSCFAVGAFLCFWGLYYPFFFLSTYARDVRGMSYSEALDLLLILNGIGLLGRLIPSFAADRVGAINIFIPMAISSAILMYAWAGVNNLSGLYAWACIYGITAGGIQAIFPAAMSSLTIDPGKQGTRIGMVMTIVSFAVLTGPPLAGALIASMGGSYLGAQMFAGTSLIMGAVLLSIAREIRRKRSGQGLVSKV